MSLKTSFRRALTGAIAAALTLLVAAPLAAQEASRPKIAILDTQQILASSALGKSAMAELSSLRDKKEAEGKQLADELEDLRKKLQEGRLSLSDDKIAELQKQAEDKAIALKRFEDDANRELDKKRQEILARVDSKVMPIINEYGKEQGYDMIFRKYESGLIYADEGSDVTQEIIRRLDAKEAAGN